MPNWILGGNFRFSSKTNDPLNGGFWLFQVQADGTAEADRKTIGTATWAPASAGAPIFLFPHYPAGFAE